MYSLVRVFCVVAVVAGGIRADAQVGPVAEVRVRAEQGDAEAQFVLGSLYSAGTVVDRDFVAAARWLLLAAEQGYVESFLPLARAYLAGNGVPQDFVSAHLWFNIAAARLTGEDRTIAVEQRDSVQAQMGNEQVAEAQRLAREWVPSTDLVSETVSRSDVARWQKRLGSETSRVPSAAPQTDLLGVVAPSLTSSSLQRSCFSSRELGRSHASQQHGSAGWFLAGLGCGAGFGLIGTGACIAASALTSPQPRTLADGSNENCYREGYRGRGKKRNILSTLGGGLLGTGAIIVILLVAN